MICSWRESQLDFPILPANLAFGSSYTLIQIRLESFNHQKGIQTPGNTS